MTSSRGVMEVQAIKDGSVIDHIPGKEVLRVVEMLAHCEDLVCATVISNTLDTTGSAGWFSSITIGTDGLPVSNVHGIEVPAGGLRDLSPFFPVYIANDDLCPFFSKAFGCSFSDTGCTAGDQTDLACKSHKIFSIV